ncbi:hypothetical protein SAY87_003942 [Trapa incisa]|uniref:Uncharacterized protein n=1 Tax=Trapa incisa TaxID=236973 RepID=A0AAN7JNP6_9MYRT|nr:hypothetical protein SAY87_003942 [Trapa incisa]
MGQAQETIRSATSQPSYQQHVPGSFPPRIPIQTQVMPCPSVNQALAASSRASDSTFQLHGNRMGMPPTAHHVHPLHVSSGTLSGAIPTAWSDLSPSVSVHPPRLPPPPPIQGKTT